MTGTIHLRVTRAELPGQKRGWEGAAVASTAAPWLAAPRGRDPWDDGGGSGGFSPLEAMGKLRRQQHAQEPRSAGARSWPGRPRASLAPAVGAAKQKGCQVPGWKNCYQSQQKVYSNHSYRKLSLEMNLKAVLEQFTGLAEAKSVG